MIFDLKGPVLCNKALHGLDSRPVNCFCKNDKSSVQMVDVYEPSLKRAFRRINIPISEGVCNGMSMDVFIPLVSFDPRLAESAGTLPLVFDYEASFDLNGDRTLSTLTQKESEVLKLIMDGEPSQSIANTLGISPHTVNFHMKNIFNKLGADNRTQAATIAYKIALEEKSRLLNEVHHRVKNNYALLWSLVQIKRESFVREPDFGLKWLNDQVYAFALLHELMIENSDNTSVSAREYFGKALAHACTAFETQDRNIGLVHDIEDIELESKKAVACMQIINELVVNAIKHAFPEGCAGRIMVRLAQEDGALVLCVSDNGRGVGNMEDIIRSESSGMKIINSLVKQLNATYMIRSDGQGVQYEVRIPQKETSPPPESAQETA